MHWYYIPDLLPPVYRQIKSMFAVAEAEDIELRQYLEINEQVLANFFIQTCDIATIEYWEQLLGIELYGFETIQQRRDLIILYLTNSTPITDLYVKKVLTDMFGADNFVYEHDPDNPFIIRLQVENTSDDASRRFIQWFARVCPAHVLWVAGRTENLPMDLCATLNYQGMFDSQAVCIEPPPLPVYGVPMGGMMSETSSSTYYLPTELVYDFSVDNITLSGFMIPMSVENTVYGNPTATSQSIVINDNDVNGILYDADGETITDQSKLYGIKSIFGTGTGSVPVNENQTCWLNSDHSNKSYISGTQWNNLYDENGAIVSGDSSNTYSIDGLYLNGNRLTSGYSFPTLRVSDGKLQFSVLLQNSPYELTNIVVSVSGSQSFTSLDTLRQMNLVSLYFDTMSRLRLKFSCAGTGITFTGTMDSAYIIAATKQQMTVDNIGLMGMIGPMGGMMTEYVPLPTVSVGGDFGEYNWLYGWGGRVYPISVNDVAGLYEYNSGAYDTDVVYDSSKSYAVIEWYSNTYLTDKGVNGVITAVENNNYLGAKNIGSESVLFHASRIAVCSSNLATVVTVYDSSNNPYNAFKYTSDGTDYYYVLDGTQTDWTDDLNSIGYRTYKIYTGWCQSDHSNINFSLWGECNLLDDGGNQITRTSGMGSPTIYKLYNSNGDEVSASFTIQWYDPYYTGTYKLMIKCYESAGTSIAKVDYKLG